MALLHMKNFKTNRDAQIARVHYDVVDPKIDIIWYYPGLAESRKITMTINGSLYFYSKDDAGEIFIAKDKDIHTGKVYPTQKFELHKGYRVSEYYLDVFNFMKTEFNKIDWDSIDVMCSLV